jgi:hypothetical protein
MEAVLRDYQGNVIAASCKYLPHVASSEMAEAIAMKAGLDLAESDSLEVIQACDGEESWWREYVAIYADCAGIVFQLGRFLLITV